MPAMRRIRSLPMSDACKCTGHPAFFVPGRWLASFKPRFPQPGKQSILGRLSGSAVGELDLPLAEPRDRQRVAFERRLAGDRVVAATVEADDQPVVLNRHGPGGLDEPTVQLLRGGLLEAVEP